MQASGRQEEIVQDEGECLHKVLVGQDGGPLGGFIVNNLGAKSINRHDAEIRQGRKELVGGGGRRSTAAGGTGEVVNGIKTMEGPQSRLRPVS